jgi:glutaredoxin
MSVVATGMLDSSAPESEPSVNQIDLYWRPGCGFCSMLQRKLDQLGIERVEHNIWDNADDAATVRRHANGNETVPTVVVGDTGFVNPSARQLVDFLAEHHPDLLPDHFEAPQPGTMSRLADKVFG